MMPARHSRVCVRGLVCKGKELQTLFRARDDGRWNYGVLLLLRTFSIVLERRRFSIDHLSPLVHTHKLPFS